MLKFYENPGRLANVVLHLEAENLRLRWKKKEVASAKRGRPADFKKWITA